MIQMNLFTRQKETHRLGKRIYGCQGKGTVREFGTVMYTLLYSKWITNTDSTWNSTQGYVPDWIGSGFGGECAALSRSVVSDSVTPIDCSPPGSSAHGILQVRILEWAAISFSRDLPNPGI